MAKPRQSDRKERIPLGGHRKKLSINTEMIPKNMARRWICDRPGRLQTVQNAGYTFVDDPNIKVGEDVEDGKSGMSSHICRTVGTHEDGRPMTAYLMKQPRKYYEEDRKLYNEELDKTDEAILGGAIGPRDEKRYVPKGGIRYKTLKD